MTTAGTLKRLSATKVFHAAIITVVAMVASHGVSRADETLPTVKLPSFTIPSITIPLPTLGGKQFWSDELFFHQWHIQRNVLTGHCRLLDGHNLQHASGTFDTCREKLQQVRREKSLPPMRGKAVIVVHGLFRSRDSMGALCKYL